MPTYVISFQEVSKVLQLLRAIIFLEQLTGTLERSGESGTRASLRMLWLRAWARVTTRI